MTKHHLGLRPPTAPLAAQALCTALFLLALPAAPMPTWVARGAHAAVAFLLMLVLPAGFACAVEAAERRHFLHVHTTSAEQVCGLPSARLHCGAATREGGEGRGARE